MSSAPPASPRPHPRPSQVYELDKKLLQAHALPLVTGYTYEMATAMRALDMDECLPQALLPPGGRPLPALPRKVLRSGSSALQRLTRMVGKSRQIYKVGGHGLLSGVWWWQRTVADAGGGEGQAGVQGGGHGWIPGV